MKIYSKRIGVLMTVILLCSCTSPSETTISSQPTEQWAQSLACDFPCWAGIVPQVTEFEDVPSILTAANIKVAFVSDNSVDFQDNETISGSIEKGKDGLVHIITLVIERREVTLADIVNLLDAPDEIVLFPDMNRNQCKASVLFLERGTVLDFHIENLSENGCQINIDSNSQIFRIVLIGDDLNQFIQSSPFVAVSRTSWRGYGIYP